MHLATPHDKVYSDYATLFIVYTVNQLVIVPDSWLQPLAVGTGSPSC